MSELFKGITLKNAVLHFKTITRHKLLVMKYCFRAGMYYQGLMHDMSKYMPCEFLVGCRYYQGNRSPNNAEREATGLSTAWLHHKGCNRHHFEYWIDYSSTPGAGKGIFVGGYMPVKYVLEMFFDRVAASRNYNLDNYSDDMPLKYYLKGKAAGNVIHPLSSRLLEYLLGLLASEGEDAVMDVIRNRIIPCSSRIDACNRKIISRQLKEQNKNTVKDVAH